MTQVKYSSIELEKAITIAPRGLVTALFVGEHDHGHGGMVKSITRDGETVTIEAAEGAIDVPWSRCVKAKQADVKKTKG